VVGIATAGGCNFIARAQETGSLGHFWSGTLENFMGISIAVWRLFPLQLPLWLKGKQDVCHYSGHRSWKLGNQTGGGGYLCCFCTALINKIFNTDIIYSTKWKNFTFKDYPRRFLSFDFSKALLLPKIQTERKKYFFWRVQKPTQRTSVIHKTVRLTKA